MATSSNTPEQGRPPETVSLPRKYGTDRKTNYVENIATFPRSDGASENKYDANCNLGRVVYLNSAETNRVLIKESDGSVRKNNVPCNNVNSPNINRSPKALSKSESCRETIRKVFFNKRVAGCKDESEIINVPNSINNNNNNQIVTVSGSLENTNRAKLRHSFHQDVEEALNSLLWQPYEYQNKQKTSNASISSSSSCSSLSSCSNLDSSNNEIRTGNTADLHLLVNNLPYNRLNQSQPGYLSCDTTKQRSGTYLPMVVSPLKRCVGATSSRYASNNTRINAAYCDGLYTTSAMRLEIQPDLSNATEHAVSVNRQAIITNARAVHQNGAHLRTPLKPTPVVRNNLSSVNVVGLPNHPRQASVPSSTSNLLSAPNHSRQISEPFRQPQTPRASINSANIVSILNHQRHTTNLSNVDPTNAHMVNHLRSSSVPKTLPQQNAASISSNLNVAHQRIGSADVNARSSNRVPLNVSNVNVNYYRAVPVNVVSSVPTIQCLNTTSDSNNVSNVNIVQAMPLQTLPVPNFAPLIPTLSSGTQTTSTTTTCTEVIVHSSHDPVRSVPPPTPLVPIVNQNRPARTFTSTEAQTDDPVIGTVPPPDNIIREQRRRERRERRHQRRINSANHRHVNDGPQPYHQPNERLPDLLNSTMPPPYTTMPGHGGNHVGPMVPQMVQAQPVGPGNILVPAGTIVQSMVPGNHVPSGLVAGNHLVPFHPVGGQVPLVQGAGPVPVPVPSPTGFRFPFPAAGFRRSRYSEEPPKSCCGLLAWRPGSLRWFIALIALVAVCCVLVGTALGAMRPAGRDHLTVSLLMIGVGIILVTVSGVAWRLTSHDSSTCRSMLGLGSTESVEVCARRFVPRLPPSYGRPHHPYAAMMYPEFQYRPPPPSYQASMQEYRLRLLLLDRGNTPQIQAVIQNTVSPPPTYRSHAGSLLRAPLSNRRGETGQSEYSCPPSYRSQTSSLRPATILHNNSIIHSRDHSLSLSESNHGDSVVNVVNILSANDEDIALDNITLDTIKIEPDHDQMNPLRMLLKGSSSELEATKDGNLVTIVQTNDQNPVIVTVSNSNTDGGNTVQITELSSEMEILAHL